METVEFASERLSQLLNRLIFQINATLARRDPEAVHDLRVAIRRFSQGLAVCKPYFAARKPKKIRRYLKDTLALAGAVRDCDIALQLLAKIQATGVPELQQKVQERRKTAAAALTERLRHWKARGLSAKWRSALDAAALPDEAGRRPIAETARRILPRDAKRFLQYGAQAARSRASAVELHQFRIAAKKFRYSLELFAELYGPNAAAWLAQLKKTQQVLGAINDCRAVRTLVSSLGSYRNVEAALKKRQARRMSDFRRYWNAEISETWTARQFAASWHQPGPRRKPIAAHAASAPAAASA